MTNATANEIVVCLFDGRHDMPENQGALVKEFDFGGFRVQKTDLWLEALSQFRKGATVKVYVTGLTFCITEFISDCIKELSHGGLVLLHFNKDSGNYVEQKII